MHEAVVAAERDIRAAEARLVEELKAWLAGDGFAVAKDFADEKNFGSRLIEHKRRSLSIRIVLDRGEWSILLAGPDRRWAHIMTWRRLVDGPDPYPDRVPLTWMVALLADRLASIQALADGPDFDRTAALLVKLGSTRGAVAAGR